MPVKRTEVKKENKWNVEAIYNNDELWQKDFDEIKENLVKISDFKGKLSESANIIKMMLETDISLSRKIEKLYMYAHMRHDEDIKNEKYKTFFDMAYSLYIKYNEITSWIIPEFLSITDEKMDNYINSEELKDYKFHLEKILRNKIHTLSEKEEKLISMAAQALSTPYNAFKSLNDGDLKFGYIDNEKEKIEITHAGYSVLLQNKNRDLRKQAFCQYHNKFNDFAMTLAALLQGKIKENVFNARARKFNTALESALFSKKIDTSVYKNLIATVRSRISSLHNYLEYRKNKMQLDKLHMYDLYVPFVESPEIKIEYDKAVELVLQSVKVLGDEYHSALCDGLKKQGWVDRYENENKRSGAYSTGSYDTMPYILMNFTGTLNSLKTLAHEAGHSMHSYLTSKYQPPIYGNYPIFLAEVASTFNEELLTNQLLKQTSELDKKSYLLNTRLEEIRATLFRQVMFAEFELLIHELVEKEIPLTYQLLKKEYKKLNEFYFGSNVTIDQEIEIEWSRIPHFYYNFYVYQYATGISAAITLYKKVINGDEQDKNDYLNFLKAGCSKYPIDILKASGVDMTSPKPINDTIDYFDEILNELKQIY